MVSLPKSTVLFAVGLLWLADSSPLVQASDHEECDACSFDGHDAADCKVYGQLHTGGLIAWHVADQRCLDFYNIHVGDPNVEATIAAIFPDGPTADETANLEVLLQFLRTSTDVKARNVKLNALKDFFQVETPGSEVLVFRDRVRLDDTYFDCTVNQGADCWTAVREYLSRTPSHLRSLGADLFRDVRRDKEEEQQSVRIEICSDAVTASSTICGPLVTQIETLLRGNLEQECNLFGLGLEHLHSPPGCHLDGHGGNAEFRAGGSTSSAAGIRRVPAVAALVASGIVTMMAVAFL